MENPSYRRTCGVPKLEISSLSASFFISAKERIVFLQKWQKRDRARKKTETGGDATSMKIK